MTERRSSVAGKSQVSMADALARYATDLRYEDLPEDIVRTAKRTILDTLGCAFGGYTAGPSQIAIKLASDVNAKRGATVLCNGIKTSPDLAAFANGVMIRYLDFNDAFVSLTHGAGHPSYTIARIYRTRNKCCCRSSGKNETGPRSRCRHCARKPCSRPRSAPGFSKRWRRNA